MVAHWTFLSLPCIVGRVEEEWERLGNRVRRERLKAGYRSAEAFGQAARVSGRTVLALERGERVAPETLILVEQALGWAAGSTADVRAGREPRLDSPELTDARRRASEERPPPGPEDVRKRLNAARVAIDQAMAVLDQMEGE